MKPLSNCNSLPLKCNCGMLSRSINRVYLMLIVALLVGVAGLVYLLRGVLSFPTIDLNQTQYPLLGSKWLEAEFATTQVSNSSDLDDTSWCGCAATLRDRLLQSGHWPGVVSVACAPNQPMLGPGSDRFSRPVVVVCWMDERYQLNVVVGYQLFRWDVDGRVEWSWAYPLGDSDVPMWAPQYMREISRATHPGTFVGIRRTAR